MMKKGIQLCTIMVISLIFSTISQAGIVNQNNATKEELNANGDVIKDSSGNKIILSKSQMTRTKTNNVANISTSSAAISDLTGVAAKLDSLKQDWAFTVMGSGIGISGYGQVDINGDGVKELILGGSTSTFGANNYWYALQYDASSSSYEPVWTSDFYGTYIGYITSIKVTTDEKHILVGRGDGIVEVFKSRKPKLVTRLNIGFSYENILDIEVADVDNDGEEEWLFLTSSAMYIYSPSDFSLKMRLAYGGLDASIGDVDADGRNEIILNNGYVLEIVNQSVVVEWDNTATGFGYKVALSDIDKDGKKEIVGIYRWYQLSTFDADLHSEKYRVNTRLDISTLYLADVDNDGDEEILYGDGQWGQIHALDESTGSELWNVNNPEHGVTGMFVSDLDQDGKLELAWSAGHTSTGPDHLYVHDLASLTQEYVSKHIDGPYRALDVGDVDNDGRQEIVVFSFKSNSGYADGVLSIFDAKTYEKKYESDVNLFGRSATTGIDTVKIGDVDNDGKNEIVVGTGRYYDGAIYIIDGVTKLVKNRYLYDNGSVIASIDLADIDNDGSTEIIAGASKAHTGSPGTYIYVIDGSTGQVKWHTPDLGVYWNSVKYIKAANVDSDNALEIIATASNSLFVIDGITQTIQQSSEKPFYSIDTSDVDLDGITDILSGTSSGEVVSVNGTTLITNTVAQLCTSPVNALRAGNPKLLDNRITFSCGDRAGVFDMEKGAVTLRSSVIGTTSGDYDALGLYKEKGNAKMIVGTNNGIRVFSAD